MNLESTLERLHDRARASRWLQRLAWTTRALLALAFLPSGATKLLGHRFTSLGTDTPVGFFFEALYRTGFYWRFLGLAQVGAAVLLLIPRTATLGAVLYFPIVLNVCLITWSLHFQGTVFITTGMLLGSTYLLAWDVHRWRGVLPGIDESPAQELRSSRS